MVLSAVVLRKTKDLEAVKTLKVVRELLGKPPKYPLHFRELRHEQRVPYVKAVAAAPIRTVSVLIHKPSITEPERFQSEAHRLYRYATRLLLERVSWMCRDFHKTGEGDGTCELTFSNRSAMSYDNLRSYLTRLRDEPKSDVRIDWGVIKPENVQAINHDQLAGLQMADAVASSLYYGLNLTQYGEVESRYFELLKPTIYQHEKTGRLGYGLKFWPVLPEKLLSEHPHVAVYAV